MPRSELHQSWARTEMHLRDARKALSQTVAEKFATELSQCDELLDHNELGLAADWLTDIATENPSRELTAIESLILAEKSMGRTLEQEQLESLLTEVRAKEE